MIAASRRIDRQKLCVCFEEHTIFVIGGGGRSWQISSLFQSSDASIYNSTMEMHASRRYAWLNERINTDSTHI